ncbi:MAG: NADH-quinone oxidoreductase subunit L [Chthoniobacteraceae bacterium]|nr:NADH-quinone oxidoreductase subunit L [Chthoniobacteraceae bacterium]
MDNIVSIAAVLVPLLPLLAAGITAFLKREQRGLSATLVITAQAIACATSLYLLLVAMCEDHGEPGIVHQFFNFPWLTFGNQTLQLGLVLDPLSAGMAAMVSFVSLLIFIYSLGYMHDDRNFTRFFTFLGLFSGAMLGVVLSNSLLLTFVAWELVGLASYLLIGFWFHKHSASAAAKKAFLTTRVGDMGFLIGMFWLYKASGTLLFYDNGAGCLEQTALTTLAHTLAGGMAVSNIIALLIFCGAAGKSGQFPLHVWLPDAMEGPTPVSALIHAATMVAAGVYLVARVFPIFTATGPHSSALVVVACIGAFTALFAALIAVGQWDIKRILAYSTVSQLGFMMLALGVGSVAAAMLHLLAHAFFKALLFLGAGSVIHGVHEEQDIRNMGGLWRKMPTTFLTYTVGMLALAGFPLFFSGFWTKDAILHEAHLWTVSQAPFYMAVAAAFLTAFYMTRQMMYVFFGSYRGNAAHPHESPAVMTVPLVILAAAAILMSLPATPAWPWYEKFLAGHAPSFLPAALFEPGFLQIAATSAAIVFFGIGLGWLIYGRRPLGDTDPLQTVAAPVFRALTNRLYVDEIYEATVIRGLRVLGRVMAWVDRQIVAGAVRAVAWLSFLVSAISNGMDRFLINFGFDSSCNALREYGGGIASCEGGRVQGYLRVLGIGIVVLLGLVAWLLA